jgi:hypothetical protein
VTVSRHLATDLLEMHVHRVGIGIRQDQGRADVTTRTDSAEYIGPLTALVARRGRRSYDKSHAAIHVFEGGTPCERQTSQCAFRQFASGDSALRHASGKPRNMPSSIRERRFRITPCERQTSRRSLVLRASAGLPKWAWRMPLCANLDLSSYPPSARYRANNNSLCFCTNRKYGILNIARKHYKHKQVLYQATRHNRRFILAKALTKPAFGFHFRDPMRRRITTDILAE